MSREAAGYRLDLEEADPLRLREPGQHRVEPCAGKAGPRRHGEPRARDDLVRLLPGQEVLELVGADHEQRLVEALRAQQVDGPRIRVEAHVVGGERGAREREPVVRGGVDSLCVPAPRRRARPARRCRARASRRARPRRARDAADRTRRRRARSSRRVSEQFVHALARPRFDQLVGEVRARKPALAHRRGGRRGVVVRRAQLDLRRRSAPTTPSRGRSGSRRCPGLTTRRPAWTSSNCTCVWPQTTTRSFTPSSTSAHRSSGETGRTISSSERGVA